ncbi:MAG: SusC/RagA family TonB-linked outer membrane protein, partial [Bacteroidales bacterium]
MEKKIVVYLLISLFAGVLNAQIKITGIVTDNENQVLPGVTISVKGEKTGTVSNEKGQYSIVTKQGDEMIFTFVGMITKSVKVSNSNSIDIQMISDVHNLNEVISIGYGTSKKSDLTGSVVSIKSENLANSRVGTVTSSLQGLAAGVQVSTGSLKPGGDATVVIRGLGSLMAGSDPLFVVDGVPVQGGLQDLSSSDIESIEVLKDASSSSIYGSRGSNGVVLVTTKKGKVGTNRITFNTSLATQSMLNKQSLMNAQQYYDLVNVASPSTKWTSEELRLLSRGGSTDWQDAVTQNGSYENYNLSISGGNKNLSHYLGFDYYNQIGTIKNSSFDKFSVRYNMDASTFSWLRYGIRLNFIESNLKNINEENDPAYGTMFSAISAQPTAPIYTQDGNYFDGFLNTKANPVAVVDLLDKQTLKNRIVGSTYLEIEPIKNLKIKSENSGELVVYDVSMYEDGRMGQHYTAGGHASIYNTKKRFLQSENTITYLTQIEKHKLTAMGGFSASGIDYDESLADAKNLSSITKYNNLGGATTFGPNSSYASSSTLASFYGRLNYNYSERYLATV